MPKTTNFGDVIRQKLANDPALAQRVEEAAFDAHIASQICDARKASGLTQQELAELVGTTQSAIARIEDADYDGHSVKLLQRVGKALHLRLRVEFCPEPAPIGGQPESSLSSQSLSEVQWPDADNLSEELGLETFEAISERNISRVLP
jgi:transcriptional regulator with XRE-family HTH domain